MMKTKTKKVPRHGEDYIIGTCILDEGKRLIGVVFRDPVDRDLYKVSMRVDTSHRTYSTIRMKFHQETGLSFSFGRHLERVGKGIKCLETFREWMKKRKESTSGINFIEHKIQLPGELCGKVTKVPKAIPRSISASSKSCDDFGSQLFFNGSWTALNPYDCNGDLNNQMDLTHFEDTASSMCIDPMAKLSFEVMEEIYALRKSLSGQEQSGTEVVAKPLSKHNF
ncbi:hypothetical protein HJC23_008695 [Cyclotella cryptica]|uniref:LAGLIDADG homing endonuclease n=1 Tax=Cyclotella cryptica TaxID=29204 RepID=A0ABD3QGL1_9STRA